MRKILNGMNITLGTCYYPEHWDPSLWKEDLERMLATGIEVIRIAEFAWNKFEPQEGVYSYEFFDEFLKVVGETGMKVIFCTPTATPPAWLTNKYPEVLNATMDGVLYRHGARRHYNYNSIIYQEFTKRIVEKIAAHYASHPSIIGWQIDNEVNCEKDVFYSESDTYAFRLFLRDKYKTLDVLNKAWGTDFWNQTYTNWDEIYVPRTTISNATNPHEVLDYFRFISESARRFVKLQSDIIRNYIKKEDFITTNGLFGHIDNHQMTRESLEFMTYDSYPNFAYCLGQDTKNSNQLKDRTISRSLTAVRGVSKVFGIMEQQSGANGWNTSMEAPTPRPGQIMLWTMQSVAHGADYISYFRWRTCTMGTEIYWHGILDYSSRENRRIKEVRDVHKRIQGIQEIAGAHYETKVGILRTYDNEWDAELDVWHRRVETVSQNGLFMAMQNTHTPYDYVCLEENTTVSMLQSYQVLFYPHAVILTKKEAKLLKEYVRQGGQLVMGCRTGYKEETGKCVMDKLPGLVSELTGTDIPEYSFVAEEEGPVYVEWDGTKIEAAVFNDILQPIGEEATVVGTYTNSYYVGEPGLIKNRYGLGTTYYFGGAFTEETARVFLHKLCIAEPYIHMIELPELCEIAVRKKGQDRYFFILNYSREMCTITIKEEMTVVETGEKKNGTVTMKGYEVLILRKRA